MATPTSATTRLHALGQSLWLDNITRGLLTSGTLRSVHRGVVGDRADVEPDDLRSRHREQRTSTTTRFARRAAKARSARRCSSSSRSRISATPRRCSGRSTMRRRVWTDGCRSKSRRCWRTTRPARSRRRLDLHARAKLPNLLIKIPGTPEGVAAIEESIAAGVPVNVTLLFSPEQYLAAANAYMRGIERRIAAGLDPKVGSVASMFISRWDKAVMRPGTARASQSPRDRRRETHVRRLPRPARLAAMAGAVEGRGAAAAPPLGEHQHERPQRL